MRVAYDDHHTAGMATMLFMSAYSSAELCVIKEQEVVVKALKSYIKETQETLKPAPTHDDEANKIRESHKACGVHMPSPDQKSLF